MRNPDSNPPVTTTASQRLLATGLGIGDADAMAPNALLALIDERLGERAAEEYVRWFVMSVLRHLGKADWIDPGDSGLSLERQYSLAQQCLALPEFASSIKTVLKGDLCKYTLVTFRRSRNARKRVLANSTVAFRAAAAVLDAAHLLDDTGSAATTAGETSAAGGAAQPQSIPATDQRDMPAAVTTASQRRASRRGFGDGISAQSPEQDVAEPAAAAREAGLSSQEYAELEAALTRAHSGSGAPRRRWQGGSDESRSWLLGVLAGFAVFAVVLFLFF